MMEGKVSSLIYDGEQLCQFIHHCDVTNLIR